MTNISTKPFPGRTAAWDVYVDGKHVGIVRQKKDGSFIGIRSGKVYGPFQSKVQATDAVVGF